MSLLLMLESHCPVVAAQYQWCNELFPYQRESFLAQINTVPSKHCKCAMLQSLGQKLMHFLPCDVPLSYHCVKTLQLSQRNTMAESVQHGKHLAAASEVMNR